ncbi:MAG: hypothetical protein IJO09_01215 [Oscillospiraceae bacterium]|nr:hypothetical protein [Oscillospiraceae bacterium]
MYKISVPIMNSNIARMGRENLLAEIEKLGAKRVFLGFGEYVLDSEKQKRDFDALRENCTFFKKHGLEVGVWIWSMTMLEKNSYMHMKSPEGKVSTTQLCPSDETFVEFAADYIKKMAACEPDIIMYDDDFRYSFLDIGMGCVCDNHIAYMEKLLGEKLDEEKISKLLSGGKNKYRDAWLSANGYFLESFAKRMREALDEVNPEIRLGQCSCIGAWDTDGTDSITISKLLAGNTKPFMRFIGAPYWAKEKQWGNRLQNIIELERMEKSWCEGSGIEVFSEGDVYPRPRTNCPASYLEIFDTALRASGGFDGILKYGIDYYSNPGYESGYIFHHIRNLPLYSEIEKHFGDKKPCGIRVYEKMKKFSDMKIPESISGMGEEIQNCFFSPASRMTSDNSIPSVYESLGVCGIAFGENATELSDEALKKGVIIDMRAAEILSENGIDVGLIKKGSLISCDEEFFNEGRDVVRVEFRFHGIECNVYDISVSEKAKIMSRFSYTKEDKVSTGEIIGSYLYENASGHKFLVFAFDAYFNGEITYRSYLRSREIKEAVEFFGEKLPAYSYGNPDLYTLAKKKENEMAVGLWNIFPDSVIDPVIELDSEYSEIECINCTGEIKGDKVYLSEIPPFSFAGFVVSKKGKDKEKI